jgi:hypothetical protein
MDVYGPGGIRAGTSPNGWSNASGLSWAGEGLFGRLGLSLDTAGLLRGLFALTGIGVGLWLAKKNLEG